MIVLLVHVCDRKSIEMCHFDERDEDILLAQQ